MPFVIIDQVKKCSVTKIFWGTLDEVSRWANRNSNDRRAKIFISSKKPPDNLLSSHSFLHNLKWFLSPGYNGRGMKFIVCSRLAPRLGMSGAIRRHPYMPSAAWTGTTQHRILFISKYLKWRRVPKPLKVHIVRLCSSCTTSPETAYTFVWPAYPHFQLVSPKR